MGRKKETMIIKKDRYKYPIIYVNMYQYLQKENQKKKKKMMTV